MIANVVGSVAWTVFYGVGAYALGHAAKEVAGPVAIGLSAALLLVVVGTVLYARRREHQILGHPMRARVAK